MAADHAENLAGGMIGGFAKSMSGSRCKSAGPKRRAFVLVLQFCIKLSTGLR
jgi:hypothetical protein